MPVNGPLTSIATCHEMYYGPMVEKKKQGYVFNLPCNEGPHLIDLSYLQFRRNEVLAEQEAGMNQDRLIVQIPEGQEEGVIIVTPDDMEVEARDPHDTKVRIFVKHASANWGDVHKARGYVYAANGITTNVNGSFYSESTDLKLSLRERSKALGLLTFSFKPFYFDLIKSDAGKITCRHMAIASIIARLRLKPNETWQDVINTQLMPENAPKTFARLAEFEHMILHIYEKSRSVDGNIIAECAAICEEHLREMGREVRHGQEDKIEREIYTVYNYSLRYHGPDAAAGHAIHIHLSAQRDHQDKLLYKMKLYDPNNSYTHTTFATNNLEDITPLAFRSLFAQKDYADYRRFDNTAMLVIKPKLIDKFLGPAPE